MNMALLRRLSSLLLAFLLPLLRSPSVKAQATYPTYKQICVYGCFEWVSYITWVLPPKLAQLEATDPVAVSCMSELKYKSIFYCAQAYCTDDEINSGFRFVNETCVGEAGVTVPSFDTIKLSSSQLAQIERVSATAATSSTNTPIADPVIPERDWISVFWRTDAAFYGNLWLSFDFSYASFAFWGFVLLAGMVYRAVDLYTQSRSRPRNGCKQSITTTSKIWLWIRSRLLLPATFGQHCQAPVAGATIPPRLESLVLLLYVIMNFIFCFPAYDIFVGNLYFVPTKAQLSRYLADRTGQLALANVPIIWVFAARNNPFIWLTGWSFATFNRFHRWVARLAFVHAVIHSVGYSVFMYQDGGFYTGEWAFTYWYCGAIATIIMSFMVAASVYYLRESHYDLFLVLHIVLAIIFVVTLWDHLHIYVGYYDAWVWPVVAVWTWDRALRYGRVIYSSVLPRVRKGVKAVVTYDASSQILRLDVTNFFPGKPPGPGLFYFVYTPRALRGYESHPFTICSWAMGDGDSELDSPIPAIDKDKKADRNGPDDSFSTSWLSSMNHSFLIRPYGGFTERLRNGVVSKAELESMESAGSREETVFLEGPYGTKLDLSTYSDVLLIAGGSGITVAISHTYHLLALGSTTVRVSWAVPQRQLVDDICNHELAAAMKHRRFKMDVHVTSENESKTDDPITESYSIIYGRPDVYEVMRNAREACARDLAVVTCGTPAMADSCRAAVVRLLKEAGPDVGYYNESMMW